MLLSKRLQAVAELVTPGNRVADVGCDHAYTSIYLIENEISPYIIAMDINQGPIDRAKENVLRYGYMDRITTRKSDGLEKLEPGEVDTVLIGGMGGALTIDILTAREMVLNSVKELVLQPQSEIYKVRRMLKERDFLIIRENMVKEDGKYYVMMKAVPGSAVADKSPYLLNREEHFHYGRLLLEQRHPVLEEFLLWDLSLCEGIMDNLNQEQTENVLFRKKEIEDRMRLVHTGLGCFIKG